MVDSSPHQFGLPWMNDDEIRRRENSVRGLTAQIDALTKIREAEIQWLVAVMPLLSEEAKASLASYLPRSVASAAPAPAKARRSTWQPAVLEALGLATAGVTQAELGKMMLEGPNGDLIRKNRNGLYVAMSQLLKTGQVRRRGDRFYTHELYEKLEAEGALEEGDGGLSAPRAAIVSILKERAPRRLMARSIIDAVARSHPEMHAKQNGNPGYVYTLLSKMVMRGDLIRSGGFYGLPSETNEAAGASAKDTSPAASITGVASDASDQHPPGLEKPEGLAAHEKSVATDYDHLI